MANGDRVYQWAPLPNGNIGRLYKMLDAQEDTSSGTWVLVGGWQDVVFAIEDADANNTVIIEGGFSEDKATVPTVAYTLHTSNSKELKRMVDGDQCMWFRCRKSATDSTATNVYMWVVYQGGGGY